MQDDIPQEMKNRIHAALKQAHKSTEGMSLVELNALTEEIKSLR